MHDTDMVCFWLIVTEYWLFGGYQRKKSDVFANASGVDQAARFEVIIGFVSH